MCEIYVRVVERSDVAALSPERQVTFLHAGDAVAICPDGHPWTKRERNSPEHIIFQLSGVRVEEMAHLLHSEEERFSPVRTEKVDFDKLPTDIRRELPDGKERKVERIEASRKIVEDAVEQKVR
jgi:hypothetical protein